MIRKLRIHLAFSLDNWPMLGESEVKLSDTHTGETLQILGIIPRKGDWLTLDLCDWDKLPSPTTNATMEVSHIVHRFNGCYIDTKIYLKPLS